MTFEGQGGSLKQAMQQAMYNLSLAPEITADQLTCQEKGPETEYRFRLQVIEAIQQLCQQEGKGHIRVWTDGAHVSHSNNEHRPPAPGGGQECVINELYNFQRCWSIVRFDKEGLDEIKRLAKAAILAAETEYKSIFVLPMQVHRSYQTHSVSLSLRVDMS